MVKFELPSVDVGTCVTKLNSSLSRVLCLEPDGRHYCCRRPESTDLVKDSGERVCCPYDEYADQIWASLASIRGLFILLCLIFAYLLLVIGWFFLTSCGIRESDVRHERRQIIRHLLRSQILHKSGRHKVERSLVGHIKHLSSTLSSSTKRYLAKRKSLKRKSKESHKSDEAPKRVRIKSLPLASGSGLLKSPHPPMSRAAIKSPLAAKSPLAPTSPLRPRSPLASKSPAAANSPRSPIIKSAKSPTSGSLQALPHYHQPNHKHHVHYQHPQHHHKQKSPKSPGGLSAPKHIKSSQSSQFVMPQNSSASIFKSPSVSNFKSATANSLSKDRLQPLKETKKR